MALRTVGVRLVAEVASYVSGMRTAGATTRDLVTEMDKAARAGSLDAVADAATGAGIAIGGAFALAVGATARFEKQMSSVQAATRASATELEMLRDAAIAAGKDTSYSATEAAQAIEELAKAGVATADILGGGLAGALDLAAAGQMDVAEAAEIAASAMTQFGLKGDKVTHIADLLAAGAGKAQGSVHDMGEALNQAGLVSAQMGLSIEETVGTLTSFASAGLLGSDAGTSLKTALLMLANPTDEARKLMEQLGISAYDAAGNFVGIESLAGQLQTRLGGLTQEQRNAAMATIFGADAIRAASILYEQGAAGVDQWIRKVDDSGYAAEVARQKTDNLLGDIERLKGELEALAIQSGSGANSGLRVLVQGLESVVAQFTSLPSAVSGTATVLAGVTGAALLMAGGWIRARRTTADALAELRATGPAGTRAARGLELTTRWAGRAAGAFLALQVASAALSAIVGKDLNPQIDALGKGLASWGRDGQLAGEAARVLGEDMEDLLVGLKYLADTDNSRRQWVKGLQSGFEGIIPGLDATNTSLTKTKERVDAMDSALAQLVSSGNASAAQTAFNRLAQELEPTGVTVEELKAMFPQYAAAVETAGGASATAADQVGEVGGAAGVAAQEVQKLKERFDELFGAQMSLDEAAIKYRQGLRDLKEELAEGARTLRTNSEEGDRNRQAMLDQIQIIEQQRQARIDNGMVIDEANGKYVREIDALTAMAIKAGFNADQVRALTGAYRELPEEASTEIKAPGAKPAKKDVENFNTAVVELPDGRLIVVKAETRAAIQAAINLRQYLKNIPDEVVNVALRVTGARNASAAAAAVRKQYANRDGGVYVHHAEAGLLSEANAWGPGDTMYAWREPGTGGELFAPRYGDMDRTRGLVDFAVTNWWGGWRDFLGMPRPDPSPAPSPAGDPAVMASAIRAALVGVSVQMDGRTVGYITGREADIYSRT